MYTIIISKKRKEQTEDGKTREWSENIYEQKIEDLNVVDIINAVNKPKEMKSENKPKE